MLQETNLKKLQTAVKPETFSLIKKNSKAKKMSLGTYLDYIFLENKKDSSSATNDLILQKMSADLSNIVSELICNKNNVSWWKKLFN